MHLPQQLYIFSYVTNVFAKNTITKIFSQTSVNRVLITVELARLDVR